MGVLSELDLGAPKYIYITWPFFRDMAFFISENIYLSNVIRANAKKVLFVKIKDPFRALRESTINLKEGSLLTGIIFTYRRFSLRIFIEDLHIRSSLRFLIFH